MSVTPHPLAVDIAQRAVADVIRHVLLPPNPLGALYEAIGRAAVDAFTTPKGQRWLRKQKGLAKYRRRYQRRGQRRAETPKAG